MSATIRSTAASATTCSIPTPVGVDSLDGGADNDTAYAYMVNVAAAHGGTGTDSLYVYLSGSGQQ